MSTCEVPDTNQTEVIGAVTASPPAQVWPGLPPLPAAGRAPASFLETYQAHASPLNLSILPCVRLSLCSSHCPHSKISLSFQSPLPSLDFVYYSGLPATSLPPVLPSAGAFLMLPLLWGHCLRQRPGPVGTHHSSHLPDLKVSCLVCFSPLK